MNSAWSSEQEDCLFLTKRSVYESHSELVVEISVGPYTSYLKVDVIFHNMICKKSVDFHDLNGDFKVLCDFFDEFNPLLFCENRPKKKNLVVL